MTKLYPQSFPGFKNAGFTLIELLVVVLIVGILSAIAVPQCRLAVGKTRYAAMMAGTQALYESQLRYFLANGVYASAVDDLDIALPGRVSVNNTTYTVGQVQYQINVDGSDSVMGLLKGGISNYYLINYKTGKKTCRAYEEGLPEQICKSMGGVRNAQSGPYRLFFTMP